MFSGDLWTPLLDHGRLSRIERTPQIKVREDLRSQLLTELRSSPTKKLSRGSLSSLWRRSRAAVMVFAPVSDMTRERISQGN